MAIVNSEIVSDEQQPGGRRHIQEQHTDQNGRKYDYFWMAEPGEDASAVAATRGVWLEADLAQREIDANAQEVVEGQ